MDYCEIAVQNDNNGRGYIDTEAMRNARCSARRRRNNQKTAPGREVRSPARGLEPQRSCDPMTNPTHTADCATPLAQLMAENLRVVSLLADARWRYEQDVKVYGEPDRDITRRLATAQRRYDHLARRISAAMA